MIYYIQLPECLRSVYTQEPDNIPEDVLTFKFPSALPHLPKSQGIHTKVTPKLENQKDVGDHFVGKDNCKKLLYTKLGLNRFPTLPDVLFFDQDSGRATIRNYNISIIDFVREANENYQGNFLETQIAKMFLDLYLAALEIHSEGFVCGAIEPQFVGYDQVHWRLLELPRLVKSSDAHLVDIKNIKDYNPRVHIPGSGLSQRDDLAGIARTVEHSMRGQMYVLMDCHEYYPTWSRFLYASFIKLNDYVAYPGIEPIEFLEGCLPLFEEMIQKLAPDSIVFPWKITNIDPTSLITPLKMTLILAKNKLTQLKFKASTESIETSPISRELGKSN